MKTITWGSFTVQTDFHPAMPQGSPPGIPPAYNQWNPANVQVVGNDLQLSRQRNSPTIWNGQHVWASSEAVIRKPLQYGTYCCSFRVVDLSGRPLWAQFNSANPHPNITATFGIFIYDPNPSSSPIRIPKSTCSNWDSRTNPTTAAAGSPASRAARSTTMPSLLFNPGTLATPGSQTGTW